MCEGIRVHEHSGMRSKVYSRLGTRCRTPLLVAHRCSCPGRSPAGNRRDTHTCTRHECWHTPRVGNAHLWRTHPHLQESRECLASWGLHAWQSLFIQDKPLLPRCPLPTQDPLTLSKPVGHGPFGPFTLLEFPVQKGGVGAGTGWQTDNRAVLKKDYVGRAKRSEVWFEYQISLPLAA